MSVSEDFGNLKYTYNTKQLQVKRDKEVSTGKWLVLLGCFLLQMIPYCITLNLNNVFVGSDWNTWVHGENIYIGLAFTLGSLISAILSPMVARLFNKRINYRLVYSFGILTALIGFMGPSIIAGLTKQNNAIQSLGIVIPILWISVVLAQIGAMIFSGIGINNLISKWWPANKRGFALGIAFAGGSLGMIWLKQILATLANHFGNIAPNPGKGVFYPLDNNQFATYLILGCIGITLGLIIVWFFCKQPLPPIQQDFNFNGSSKTNTNSSSNDASPLDTRKYPLYWILAIGYLFIQMGTIHSSMNGLIIANTTVIANDNLNYNDVMGIGGTIFGVSCIAGNVISGYLNDKLKPSRSIFFAGIIQCLAIFCLMYSVKNSATVYIYFILAGISVYIYTTMPAYISGRLYGPTYSNNHMAILSIFLAVGFAIINSISGVLTGPTGFSESLAIRNPHSLFGITTAGNFFALEMFALVSMLFGTIVVAISCSLIRQKTIKGIKQYYPTKISYIINFKYGILIKFWANICILFNRPLSTFKYHNKKMKHLQKIDNYYQCYQAIEQNITKQLKEYKLTKNQLRIIATIYFYTATSELWIHDLYPKLNIKKSITPLIEKGYVRTITDNKLKLYYLLDRKLAIKINEVSGFIFEKYPNFVNERIKLRKAVYHSNDVYDRKNDQLLNKINKIKQKHHINENSYLLNKSNKKINKYKKLQNNIKTRSEWKRYLLDFKYAEKITYYQNLLNNIINKKEYTINKLKQKIENNKILNMINKSQKINGHCFYMLYLNNKTLVYQYLINKKILTKLGLQIDSISSNKNKYQKIIQKIKNKQEQITNQFASKN